MIYGIGHKVFDIFEQNKFIFYKTMDTKQQRFITSSLRYYISVTSETILELRNIFITNKMILRFPNRISFTQQLTTQTPNCEVGIMENAFKKYFKVNMDKNGYKPFGVYLTDKFFYIYNIYNHDNDDYIELYTDNLYIQDITDIDTNNLDPIDKLVFDFLKE